MDNRTLFTIAHALTKKTIKPGDNYQVNFGQALKQLRLEKAHADRLSALGEFTVVFKKRTNGDIRTLTGAAKKEGYRVEHGLLTVIETSSGEYRSIPLDAILKD